MRVARRAAAVVAALVVTTGVAACGAGPVGPAETAEQLASRSGYNPQPYDNVRDGGTLTTGISEISPQFNTWHGDGTAYTQTLWDWYNPVLFTYTPEGVPAPNPDYLVDAKAEQVGGNTRVTLTFNPKAVFNDGTPIDWRAVEAAWKADNGKDPAYVVNGTDGFDRMTSVARGVDDKQAVVTFGGVDLWWQSYFGGLLHPAALPVDVFNKGYVDNPRNEWGAGPYQVKTYDKQNGLLSFERNPRWWGKPGKLDTRTFLQMDSKAAVNAFRNGQLDAITVGNADSLSQVQGMPGVEIRKGPGPSVNIFTLNGKSPLLADVAVRKAIFEAIDRTQIAKIFFNGLGYTADPTGSVQMLPYQEGYADNVSKVVRFDPATARADLDAAGWVPGPDGIREKDGKRLQLSYVHVVDSTTFKAVATGVAAMLKEIGVQVDIRLLPSSDYSRVVKGKEFDIFHSGINWSGPDTIAYLCQTYCSGSTLVNSGVNDPKNDALMRSVNSLPTVAEQYAKAAEAETAGLSTYGILPTVNQPVISAVKHGLANAGSVRFAVIPPEEVGWQK